jgi:hypothetical protein
MASPEVFVFAILFLRILQKLWNYSFNAGVWYDSQEFVQGKKRTSMVNEKSQLKPFLLDSYEIWNIFIILHAMKGDFKFRNFNEKTLKIFKFQKN